MTARELRIHLLLIGFLLPGLAGVHDHFSFSHGHDQIELGDERDSTALAGFAAEHHEAHEHRGEIDVEPPEKAFSKGSSLAFSPAALLAGIPLARLDRSGRQLPALVPPWPPPTPPLRAHFHPPSQAPPAAV